MIQIPRYQLEEIQYLLEQSANGIHFLFDQNKIKKILSAPTEDQEFFTFENVSKVQQVLTSLIEKKTFFEKLHYLNKLDPDSYELLVRSYFNIVDNSILEEAEFKH